LWVGCDLSSFLLSVSSDGRGVVSSLEQQRLFLITKADEKFLLEQSVHHPRANRKLIILAIPIFLSPSG
jgi:hypothetical protein